MKPTDLLEVQALIRLLYYAELLKANNLNADDLWKSNVSGVEMFCLIMSLLCFRFLLRYLRMDDKVCHEERINLQP